MAVKAPLNFPGRHFALSPPRFSISPNPPHRRPIGGTNSLKLPLCIRTGYTRKPTGTPGAYHLIDEETGEKFIVWGGLENDDDAPIPSDQVLSWKPRAHPKKQTNRVGGDAVEVSTVDSSSNDSTPRNTILAPSFGRLKAQRVKALIKRSPKVRQQNFRDFQQSGDMSPLDDTTDTSFSEVELLERKKISGSLAAYKGKMPRAATQLPKAKDSVRNREMDPEEKENDFDQISEEEFPSVKPHQHGAGTSYFNASVPRGSSSLRGWSNANSTQSSRVDSFDTFKWQKKMVSGGGFFSRKLFKDVGCSEDMIESLKSQHFSRPSHIQAMAYVPALEGKSCIIADQSGSGKTLAYLAPIIQRLRQEELQGLGKPSSSSPRVVILVPTAELASQVLNSCRSISKFGVPFRSMVATGGFRQKTQLDNLQQGLDVLIATPGRFMFLLQEGFLKLSDLKCAVLDEVDILFGDEGFERVLQSLLNLAPVTTQYLFVTATLPVDIYNKLVEVFPDCEAIMGPGVHRTSSGLEEVLVDCSGADGEEKTPETAFLNKKSALLRLVEENPVLKTIVFCNKIETCRKVENILKRLDKRELHIGVLPFHAALAQEVRLTNMKEFLNSQAKDSLFLISTDRASRGIDFSKVDHVVLFDFPRDPSEYVRRVGRTARGAGGKGKAFVFVIGKQVSLARRIMERNQKGHPLHDVPSAYELMS